MKRLLIAAGCLFLSACSVKKEPQADLGVVCWDAKNTDKIVYSGSVKGGLAMVGTSGFKGNPPAITFIDALTGKRVVINIKQKLCAVVSTR